MKRFLTAIVACIMLFITLGTNAEASTGGAERAVRHEVCFDYDCRENVGDLWFTQATCNAKGHGNYTCSIWAQDDYRGHSVNGKARVTQYGKRYSVSYRIYW